MLSTQGNSFLTNAKYWTLNNTLSQDPQDMGNAPSGQRQVNPAALLLEGKHSWQPESLHGANPTSQKHIKAWSQLRGETTMRIYQN